MEIKAPPQNEATKPKALVAAEDAELVKKIHRVLRTGKNAEVRQDKNGSVKVFKVSREIEK